MFEAGLVFFSSWSSPEAVDEFICHDGNCAQKTVGKFLFFSKLVVSCDLILLKYVAFSTHEYFNGPAKKFTLSLPPFTFRALKMIFYVLKHNVPLYLTHMLLSFSCG